MKDLMAAWANARDLFNRLINGGEAELDNDDVGKLSDLREEIRKLENLRPIDEMLKKLTTQAEQRRKDYVDLRQNLGIVSDLACAHDKVVSAQGADIKRLTQAVRVLEKRCEEIAKSAAHAELDSRERRVEKWYETGGMPLNPVSKGGAT